MIKGISLTTTAILMVTMASAQLSFMVNLPPAGLTTRMQLWNITIMNATNTPASVYVECRMIAVDNGNTIMTATTNTWSAMPGNSVVSYSQVLPVQYNIVDPAFQGFSMSELLPVGTYQFCYVLWNKVGDRFDRISEDCQIAVIEPMSPPLLMTPALEEELETPHPVFTWLPPTPIQQFIGLTYDISLSEVVPGQSPLDAVRLNIPILVQSGLPSATLPYQHAYPPLRTGKVYAWQVLARSNGAPVSSSDVWSFTYRGPVDSGASFPTEGAYPKLSRERSLSYAIMEGDLRLEYLNSTSDSTWNVQLTTLSKDREWVQAFNMDSIPLRHGKNHVRIRAELLPFLQHQKLYQLQLRNSSNEIYWLRFEYRRRDQ